MAARVLAFQQRKPEFRNEPQAQASLHQDVSQHRGELPPHGLHLVQPVIRAVPVILSNTQQQASRIVAEVSEVQLRRGPSSVPAVLNERSPQFWATLPQPQARLETPYTVARRLVHLLLTHPRSA